MKVYLLILIVGYVFSKLLGKEKNPEVINTKYSPSKCQTYSIVCKPKRKFKASDMFSGLSYNARAHPTMHWRKPEFF